MTSYVDTLAKLDFLMPIKANIRQFPEIHVSIVRFPQ
jgi:hypothetical protein